MQAIIRMFFTLKIYKTIRADSFSDAHYLIYLAFEKMLHYGFYKSVISVVTHIQNVDGIRALV